MTTLNQPRVTKINFDHVIAAYSGRPGCACGCRGRHVYPSAKRDLGGLDRGYPVSDDEVSDRSVKTIITRMLATGDAHLEDDHVWAETPTRLYIVTLDTSKRLQTKAAVRDAIDVLLPEVVA